MKKRVQTISAVLILACLICALYLYVDRKDKSSKTETKSLAGQMLEQDLEKNYPPTPYAVAEKYCQIIECLYNSKTTEEEVKELVRMERQLFDEEFAAQNPYESFLLATQNELAQAKETSLVFTGYVLDKASNVQKWTNDLGSYASLQISFALRSENGSGTSYRNLIMRKDKENHYRIIGWKTEE